MLTANALKREALSSNPLVTDARRFSTDIADNPSNCEHWSTFSTTSRRMIGYVTCLACHLMFVAQQQPDCLRERICNQHHARFGSERDRRDLARVSCAAAKRDYQPCECRDNFQSPRLDLRVRPGRSPAPDSRQRTGEL